MNNSNVYHTNLMNPANGVSGFVFIVLVLAWFALSLAARAVDPPPDGGYPGQNTAEGEDALFSLTDGEANTAVGYQALFSNTTGSGNTANGLQALFSNTIGEGNTASGYLALFSNTEGIGNTATGDQSLIFNTTGVFNTATGVFALFSNTTGQRNTASGTEALTSNTTGSFNTATGLDALFSNTEGSNNTADGEGSLFFNTTGVLNAATGSGALFTNTTGNSNAATGAQALERNTTGNNNTAIGASALFHNTIGNGNIALGFNAGTNLTTGNNNIDIGNDGVAAEANTIRIGTVGVQTNAFIAGINGVTIARGVAVVIDANGHLGTRMSSARFKDEIKPMDKASEALLALKPVTFRYKKELDPDGTPQFGLVAEEVEKVNPDLVARDAKGEVYTVRYEAVNAMLLNEFLKEHRKVEKLEAIIAQQQKDFQATTAEQQQEIETLTTSVREQASQIQKVSARLEVSSRRGAPRMVVDNQ